MADVLVNQADFENAREALERAIEADPHYYKPFPMLTALTVEAADWSRVAELAARWKGLRPGETQAWMYEAVARLNLGELDEAARLAQLVLQSADAQAHPGAHHIVGMVHQAHGRLTDADREYRSLLERQPDGPVADQLRGLIAGWEHPDTTSVPPEIVIEAPAPPP